MLYKDSINIRRGLKMTDHSFHIESVSATIFYLIDINMSVMEHDGSILLELERNPFPDFLFEFQKKDFSVLRVEAEQHLNHCCIYTNEFGLSYLANLVEVVEGDIKLFVIGPFLKQTPDTQKLKETYKIDEKKMIIFEEFLRGLKLISNSKIKSIANVLYTVRTLREAPLHSQDAEKNTSKRVKATHHHGILQQVDEEYTDLIDLRYKIENEIMHAVELGKKAKLEQSLSMFGNLFDFSERLPGQPVRVMKNGLIILNTLLRIAARNGKVHPFYLHHISEKFAIQIERIDSIDSLDRMRMIMCHEYCDLVKTHAISGYSSLIQKAVRFLDVHYSKPFDLKHLAEYCFVHPAHLSRQFKKETGMTITEFLQKKRIEEAKLILKTDYTSIDEIAGYVGFDDAGYFTRIFKKIEGITPTEYRNANH
ncbi:AraC family transcriptional regulator [Fodinisporobacter ferrooxydans]|uniref:AraC family transcriptional regulator n=1 Tax=Fodinisporobacter ferrooxydans TaxID=2901836 RepID=A0ABY4CGZ5_9BACL|nr:AraC family transcriptional regulator [Alicyclobacillaceae bacterium MYW30-H2]